jgi:hypothetical protein
MRGKKGPSPSVSPGRNIKRSRPRRIGVVVRKTGDWKRRLSGWCSLALPGGVADGAGDQAEVALVEAGDGVAEAAGVVGGEAGRDSDDALLPAGCWQVPAVERGYDGVPVDPRHRVPSLMLAGVSTWG